MTLALARKWRPKTFGELVGQEHVVRALTNALEQQRLHHAWLFTGTRGVGKTTLARILAKALNCETGVTAKPCGACDSCLAIDAGRFVDVLELDAASNTQVDNMRELLDNAMYAPTCGRYKVYVIDEVHMLSRSAFNAMLKTLEEPPEHAKFVLATTDPQKVPVTVLSRCLQFNLKQIPAAQIRAQLRNIVDRESVEAQDTALALLARAAQGSMRDALSLLDQAIAHGAGKALEAAVREMLGAVDRSYLIEIVRALIARDGGALLGQADRMAERSLSFDGALEELATLLHRLALAKSIPGSLAEDDPDYDALMLLVEEIDSESLQLMYQIALLGRRDLGLAPDEYAGFTMSLLRMLTFYPSSESGDQRVTTAADSGEAAANEAPAGKMAHRAKPDKGTIPETENSVKASSALAEMSDWRRLVSELKIGGMARMLADHCELRRFEGNVIELSVPEAHRHLSEPAYNEKLQTVLREHFGSRVRLKIEIGGNGDTPAAQEDRENKKRLEQAIEAIDTDPFVRDLVESLDAKIRDDSIKPV
ncbi:MAG: DNA polymerase III subunit gamma/tau [Betaproteobacteria bacterium]|jgi:DNA polymerase-3 subunit gamma/tau|nr:MAG: DNA polymerase III subunit gamma/tau [Betaproteobacteria bacterium]